MKFNITVVNGTPVLMPPPPGYEVNLDNPKQQHDVTAYIVFGIGLPISTFFFAQYAYVKLRLLRKFDVQFVCVLLGWIFSLAMQSIDIKNFTDKLIGVHTWEMSVWKAERQAHDLVITTALNAVMTGFCKTSLGLFYVHLSPHVWWKWTSWSALFLMVGYNAAVFFAIMFGCVPIQKNWNPSLPGHCIQRAKLYIARAALGALSDFLLLLMPIPMIVGLQMPTRQKIGLVIFFAIGSVTCVTAALRCYLLLPTLHSHDITWTVSSTAVVILAESHLLVICSCLPTLRQFFAHIAPHVIGERGSSAKKSQSTGPDPSYSFKTIGNISNNRKKVDELGMTVDEENISLHPVKTDHPNHSDYSVNTNGSFGMRKKKDQCGMTIYEENYSSEMVEEQGRVPRHFNTTNNHGDRKRVDNYGMTTYEERASSPDEGPEYYNGHYNMPVRHGNQKRLNEHGLTITIYEESFYPHDDQQPGYTPQPPHADYYGHEGKADNYGVPAYEETHPNPKRRSEKSHDASTNNFNPANQTRIDNHATPEYEKSRPYSSTRPDYEQPTPANFSRGSQKRNERDRSQAREAYSKLRAVHDRCRGNKTANAECTTGHQSKAHNGPAPAYEERLYPDVFQRPEEQKLRPPTNLISRGRANMKSVDEFGWTKYEDDFYPQTPGSPERPSQLYKAIDSCLSPTNLRITGDNESFGTFGKAEQAPSSPPPQGYPYDEPIPLPYRTQRPSPAENMDQGGARSTENEGDLPQKTRTQYVKKAHHAQTSWLDSPNRSSCFLPKMMDNNFF